MWGKKMTQEKVQTPEDTLRATLDRIRAGGAPRYHESAAKQGKLFARERLRRLLDPPDDGRWTVDDGEAPSSTVHRPSSSVAIEDGLLANNLDPELPADGVITGIGMIHGCTVCYMANDSTVKAGSWGWRTVEKIIRILETAAKLQVPMVYLVDSAGARITDQVEMFPGRRGAGRIFWNQVRLSGLVPQVCLLLGPSAVGGAYIPAFCDLVIMVEGNASMYLGSPRMAEMVIGEKVTLEQMGGARMHCTVSGCGDMLVQSEEEGIAAVRRYLEYLPQSYREPAPGAAPAPPVDGRPLAAIVPSDQNRPFDMQE